MNHMTDLAKMQTLIEQVWAKEDRDGNLNKLLAGGKAAALQVMPWDDNVYQSGSSWLS